MSGTNDESAYGATSHSAALDMAVTPRISIIGMVWMWRSIAVSITVISTRIVRL